MDSRLSRSIIPAPRTTTQTFFGSDDLDISGLQNTAISIGRIYVENSTPVTASLKPGSAGWVAGSSIELEILQANNRVIAHQLIRHAGTVAPLETIAQTTGWHTFRAKGTGLGGPVPYQLTATYRGANQLTAG
jgi:hypothetical protein